MPFPKTEHALKVEAELLTTIANLEAKSNEAAKNGHMGSSEIYQDRADELRNRLEDMFSPSDDELERGIANAAYVAGKREFEKLDVSKLEYIGEIQDFRTYYDADTGFYWTTRPDGSFDDRSLENPFS